MFFPFLKQSVYVFNIFLAVIFFLGKPTSYHETQSMHASETIMGETDPAVARHDFSLRN